MGTLIAILCLTYFITGLALGVTIAGWLYQHELRRLRAGYSE